MVFFFNDTATTEIYTLSLHDALPISGTGRVGVGEGGIPVLVREPAYCIERRLQRLGAGIEPGRERQVVEDRKSTRLNSSHANISYAVFCLKKKNIHYS